jgi:hypothetical protein
MSNQAMHSESTDCSQGEPDANAQRLALQERAQVLGATAEELAAALEELALHAEMALRRLRGAPLH